LDIIWHIISTCDVINVNINVNVKVKVIAPLQVGRGRLYTANVIQIKTVLGSKICQSRHFSKGVGHFDRKFQTEWGVAHQPLLVSENQSDCPLVCYRIKISAVHCLVLSQSARVTDRRTDRLAAASTAISIVAQTLKPEKRKQAVR